MVILHSRKNQDLPEKIFIQEKNISITQKK